MRLRQESRLAGERRSMKLRAEISQRIRWSLQHPSVCEDIWFSFHLEWTLHVTVNLSSWDISDKDLCEEIKRSEIYLEESVFPLKKKTGAELVSSSGLFVYLFVGQISV